MKSPWTLLAVGLLAGAAVMYASRNVKVQFKEEAPTAVVALPQPIPALAPSIEPPRAAVVPRELPKSLLGPQTDWAQSKADPAVVRAGGQTITTTPTATTAPTTPPIAPPTIKSVVDAGLAGTQIIWPANQCAFLVSNKSFTLSVDGVADKTIVTLNVVGPDQGNATALFTPAAAANGQATIAVNNAPAGTYRLTVAATATAPASQVVQVSIPEDPTTSSGPTITNVQNGQFATPVAFDAKKAVNMYGGFMNLTGNVGNSPSLKLNLFKLSGTTATWLLTKSVPINDKTSVWELRSLPVTAADSYLLILMDADGNAQRMSSTPLTVAAANLPAVAKIPTIDGAFSSASDIGNKPSTLDSPAGAFAVNTLSPTVTGTATVPTDGQLVLVGATASSPITVTASNTWTIPVKLAGEKNNVLTASIAVGPGVVPGWTSKPVDVEARQKGPRAIGISPTDLSQSPPGQNILVVSFDPDNALNADTATKAENFAYLADGDATAKPVPNAPVFDSSQNRVSINMGSDLKPGVYQLQVKSGITDLFGNKLGVGSSAPGDEKFQFIKPIDTALPSVSKGVTFQTGPFVTFPEYTPPRQVPEGFNPSDKVDTRVARLFYNRDAHRVAQIINREVKSYNAVSVDVRRRAADAARDNADKAQDQRQLLEQQAVRAAQASRALEAQMAQLQAQLQAAISAASNPPPPAPSPPSNDTNAAAPATDTSPAPASTTATAQITAIQQQISQVSGQLTAARDKEATANDAVQTKTADERRLREDQFRREVAAAKEDPDTYAPGDPFSMDPVKQVSISVVGEGLIQLRGPLKGVNIIRKMINQMDAPVGQVRVGVYTVQVNGERGDRMEKVIADIQKYIDQSRFMTTQTAEMLRKAIVQVATQKALELGVAGDNQQDRDFRYLYAFFGKDFTDELRTLDSEFLHTGNKLLSLHSMDTTSLASALMLMALAKNNVRLEILREFQRQLQMELPEAEMNFLLAGSWSMCKSCRKGKPCKECFLPLAENAKFQSLIGFFNAEFVNDNTMTPLQREFIRLAQIYKASLVTEIELGQRNLERSLVEERLGQTLGNNEYIKARRDAFNKEKQAQQDVQEAERKLAQMQGQVVKVINLIIQNIVSVQSICQEMSSLSSTLLAMDTALKSKKNAMAETFWNGNSIKGTVDGEGKLTFAADPAMKLDISNKMAQFSSFALAGAPLKNFETVKIIGALLIAGSPVTTTQLQTFENAWMALLKTVGDVIGKINADARDLLSQLSDRDVVSGTVFQRYSQLRDEVMSNVQKELSDRAKKLFDQGDAAFSAYFDQQTTARTARKIALLVQSPLDHKKFLDLLIDDVEDKYIAQLEGTRAHTANIDNYLKRIATALDDDFNRQFYQPMFRCVRDASRLWDVTLGQVESTTLLMNNRSLGKCAPAASFEFDLPKRDITIVEAMKGAKAMMDDYGALLNDPTFLALAKLRSGQPTSSTTQGLVNGSPVRNVLPGLPSSSDEQVMAQGGPGNAKFNSQLEALIPDPAIYKVETGTGFEIHPVISPDGQAVVFEFDYMYTTNIREPVKADEKHLGKVDRHFIHTDVQLSNYELREVSKYNVGLKVSRTGQGVQLLQDIPGLGVLFRPAPSSASALQQNIIMAGATIFPTLFDLTGLRYAPAIADLDPLHERSGEFIYRNRDLFLKQQVTDRSAQSVDEALRIPVGERRPDLYRPQRTIPDVHPNGYMGPGLNRFDVPLREGYSPNQTFPPTPFGRSDSNTGVRPPQPSGGNFAPLQEIAPPNWPSNPQAPSEKLPVLPQPLPGAPFDKSPRLQVPPQPQPGPPIDKSPRTFVPETERPRVPDYPIIKPVQAILPANPTMNGGPSGASGTGNVWRSAPSGAPQPAAPSGAPQPAAPPPPNADPQSIRTPPWPSLQPR